MASYAGTQSTAIDFDRFAAAKDKTKSSPLKVLDDEASPAKRQTRARIPYIKYGVICVYVFALLVLILYSYTTVTELTTHNDRMQKQITSLQGAENALNAKKEQLYNLADVEDYAKNVLGMVKMDKSAIEYLELSSPEKMTVSEISESGSSFFAGLAKSFSVVLEYLN